MTLDLTTEDRSYRFTLYPLDTKFYQVAGIYIFFIIPKITEPTVAEPLEPVTEITDSDNSQKDIHLPASIIQPYSLLYAGITNNFRGRFNGHHKIKKAIQLGMTHIGILKITSALKRKKIERQILQYLNPPLNQTWLNDITPNPVLRLEG